MHLKRWITVIATLPLLILLIWKGGSVLFALFIVLVSTLSLWEYFRIVFNAKGGVKQGAIPFFAFVTGPIIIWAAGNNSFDIILGIITLNLIVSSLLSLPRFKSDSFASEIVTNQVLGIVYVPLFLSCLVLIRNGANGVAWIFLLLCIIFSGDTGAYYVGSYFGRHKLCPAVSPGKTIEGAVGGLFSSLAAGALFKYFFLPYLSWSLVIPLILFINIAGQVGDLFESGLKRSANIKDSGAILPGHGGILDRIDALLFAAPVAFFFKEYIV